VIGARETFCSYCGVKVTIVREKPQLDPPTLTVALTMIDRVTKAHHHTEYNEIDQRTARLGDALFQEGQARDVQELSLDDQYDILDGVFKIVRDDVPYRPDVFGEHVRWPWETLIAGGDCDCKVVLLAAMLASVGFRRMWIWILAPGTYFDPKQQDQKKIEGHVFLEVELSDRGKREPRRLRKVDPSCEDCSVGEISESIEPFLENFYKIPIFPIIP